MENIKKYPISFCSIVLILLISILDISNTDIEFSLFENRTLAQKPKFYYDDFKSGRYFKNYERYINDQFLLRNSWINVKSLVEFSLGKKENNGVIYGDNNFLFDKFEKVDESNLAKNINSLKSFISSYNSNYNLMIIPESFSIYKEFLPAGINLVDEVQYINSIYSEFTEIDGVKTINIVDTLNSNKDSYIYYKTDHHWTSLGAYLAYKEFANINNIEPVDINNLNENRVDDFFGTYFSKAKNFNAKEDYILYYNNANNINVNIDGVEVDELNDNSKWSSSDKYSAFLRGNNGITIIKNNSIKDNSKILVIKDSFANSFIQFLINNYKEVYVVDLRSFIGSFNDFINENDFDTVLIMYSFNNLVNDVNISRIKY